MRVFSTSFLALMFLFGKLLCFASSPHSINVAEEYLLSSANHERTARGLAPLVWDSSLATAAWDHARLMASRGTISHHFAEELDLSERVALAGTKFSVVAENVAEAPLATYIHEGWMGSEGHRANLLDPEVDAVGIAVVVERGQLYAVEDFAHVTRLLAVEEQEKVVAALLGASGLTILPGAPDARRACASMVEKSASTRPEFILRYNATMLDRLPEELAGVLAKKLYRAAAVGACDDQESYPFQGYRLAILLYR